MDASAAFTTGGATATIMIVGGFVYRFWNEIKNHMIVSRCCGRKIEIGVGVKDMPNDTPPGEIINVKKMELRLPGAADTSD